MSNIIPAVVKGTAKQQRNTYVSWPAPPTIRKHKDFWTQGDQEPGRRDVLHFKLTHVVSTENMFDKTKPDRVAHYQQIEKTEYEALAQSQAALEANHAQLVAMQQAEKTAQYKQQYAQQLMQYKGPKGENPWWGSLANVTSAPTQPQAALLPPKPEPPSEPPLRTSVPSIPDPIVPKRRMMKA